MTTTTGDLIHAATRVTDPLPPGAILARPDTPVPHFIAWCKSRRYWPRYDPVTCRLYAVPMPRVVS